MKKIIAVVISVLLVTALLAGCTLPDAINTITDAAGGGDFLRPEIVDDSKMDPVEVSNVEIFSFGEGGGMEVWGNTSYQADLVDGQAEIRIKPYGIPDDEALEVKMDASFMDEITEICKKYDIGKWNGFDKSDTGVMDGSSFHLLAMMDNGKEISASGYEVYPDNYSDFSGAIASLFGEVYETYRPDQGNALERYYEETIVPEKGETGEVEIKYPYIALGENRFKYGDYEGETGAVFHMVTDIDDDGGEDMLVVYQEQNTDDEGNLRWDLTFEVYTCDDQANVTLVGSDVFDTGIFWCDDLYAEVFFCHEPGTNKRYIGYAAQYEFTAADATKDLTIKLFDMGNGKLEKLCDEWQTGPIDREKWTYEELSNFIEIAEKYGWSDSLEEWKEFPHSPLPTNLDVTPLIVYLTDTNYDSGFSEALASTEPGQPVGDYGMEGKLASYY